MVLRRLNRNEYENTVRDLLGVQVDLKEQLPEDSSAGGFDNVGEALHLSSFLMERYLEAAEKALNVAIANGPKPPPSQKKRYSMKDARQVKMAMEKVFLVLDDAVVCFTSVPWQSVSPTGFSPKDAGLFRVRISSYGYQSDGKPVTYKVDAGQSGKGAAGINNNLVGYFDAPGDKPAVVEFVKHLEAQSSIRILPYGLASSKAVGFVGAKDYRGPGLASNGSKSKGPSMRPGRPGDIA